MGDRLRLSYIIIIIIRLIFNILATQSNHSDRFFAEKSQRLLAMVTFTSSKETTSSV